MTADARISLDERGRPCPLPIIALARAMSTASPGTTIEVLSDDPAARYDVPAWCRMTGHVFVSTRELPDADPPAWRLVVRHS